MPRFGDRHWYAADLLATALAGGKSSPLYEDLVYRRQIAQDVGVSVFPTELCATFLVVATGRPEVAPADLEAALGEHLDRCAATPMDGRDLERARNQLLTGYFQELQRLDSRADLFSFFTTCFDDPGRIATEPDRYGELGGDDLASCAAAFLRPDQRVVVTVVPRGSAP